MKYHEILDEDLDFIIRFERIQADFSAMLKKFDLPDLVLPHVEHRARDHYRAYFDDETASLVAAMFEKDISDYGYVF